MSTATLHPKLQGDVEIINLINAVAAMAAGLIVLAIPGTLIRLFQLHGATERGVRAVGLLWLAIGLWMAVTSRGPRSRRTTTINAVLLAGTALFLLAAPFIFGLAVGAFGWFTLFFLALYFGGSAVV